MSNKALEEEEYLTVMAAAKYLNISRDKLARMIKEGKLSTEDNPLDARQKLIVRSKLDRLKKSVITTHMVPTPKTSKPLEEASALPQSTTTDRIIYPNVSKKVSPPASRLKQRSSNVHRPSHPIAQVQ